MSRLMVLGTVTVLALSGCAGPAPALPPAPEPDSAIQEDESGWDCRTHGNQLCGVQVQGVWYVLDFATGTFVPR